MAMQTTIVGEARLEPFAAGLGDHRIVTTLCPGGKERMRRLLELVRHGRIDAAAFADPYIQPGSNHQSLRSLRESQGRSA